MQKGLATFVAGVLATLIWPMLEPNFIDLLADVARHTVSWRVAQLIAGTFCAIAISLPAALLIHPTSPWSGLLYVATVLVTQFLILLATDALRYMGQWASLPDTRAFLFVSLMSFLWVSRRSAVRHAA